MHSVYRRVCVFGPPPSTPSRRLLCNRGICWSTQHLLTVTSTAYSHVCNVLQQHMFPWCGPMNELPDGFGCYCAQISAFVNCYSYLLN